MTFDDLTKATVYLLYWIPVSVGEGEVGDGQEGLHNASVAEFLYTLVDRHSEQQWRGLHQGVISVVEIYTRDRAKPLHHGGQITDTGPHQCSLSFPICLVDIGPLGEEKLQRIHFLSSSGQVKPRRAIFIPLGDVSSKTDQSLDSTESDI